MWEDSFKSPWPSYDSQATNDHELHVGPSLQALRRAGVTAPRACKA